MNGGALTLIDMFVRGIAVGAMVCLGLSVWRSAVSRDAKLATMLAAVSLSAWMITESHPLWGAFGSDRWIMFLALPVSGMFWLLIQVVFEDRKVSLLTLSPALVLVVTGLVLAALPPGPDEALWMTRNLFGGLLSLHSIFIIVRGWRGDLLQARRQARGLLLGFAAAFGVLVVALSLVNRIHPLGSWMMLTAGQPYGGMIMAVITVATAALFLQARPSVFGSARRAEPVADVRAEAADRAMLRRLEALMEAEGWRREGLTIGGLAEELGTPEHRLRRLINHRLGHRNFADFLNAHRIEAAKRRLADPAEARTTVAAIAFDLGYGSLGPFNRAFRAATGSAPTEWRRQALQASPELSETA